MATVFTIKDILTPQAVMVGLEGATKKEILQSMARLVAEPAGLDPMHVFNTLWERERLGTTGVGHGIAIPHCRLGGVDEVQGFFARLSAPVDFESVDNKPVDLVFLLLAPETAGADHLHAFATVSRLLRDPALCEGLRQAKSADAVYALLNDAQATIKAA